VYLILKLDAVFHVLIRIFANMREAILKIGQEYSIFACRLEHSECLPTAIDPEAESLIL
jgi:hypothetical protein